MLHISFMSMSRICNYDLYSINYFQLKIFNLPYKSIISNPTSLILYEDRCIQKHRYLCAQMYQCVASCTYSRLMDRDSEIDLEKPFAYPLFKTATGWGQYPICSIEGSHHEAEASSRRCSSKRCPRQLQTICIHSYRYRYRHRHRDKCRHIDTSTTRYTNMCKDSYRCRYRYRY